MAEQIFDGSFDPSPTLGKLVDIDGVGASGAVRKP